MCGRRGNDCVACALPHLTLRSVILAAADQIASCANMLDNRVHVWDVRRPYLPIAICYGHQNVATGLSWIESDVGPAQRFLACSKDATLALHDVTKAYKPTEHISASAVALSPFNIAAVSDHVGASQPAQPLARAANRAPCR